MTKLNYPKSVAAALSSENSQWRLGDALLEEVGPPSEDGVRDGSHIQMAEVAAEIAIKGGDGERFSPEYLSRLRTVSDNFPEDTRRVSLLSWSIHHAAGSPEILDKIIELAGDIKSVTRDGVRKYLETQRSKSTPRNNRSTKKPPPKPKPKKKSGSADFFELMALATDTSIEGFEEKYDQNPEILDHDKWLAAITEQIVMNINEWKRILDKISSRHHRRAHLKVVS